MKASVREYDAKMNAVIVSAEAASSGALVREYDAKMDSRHRITLRRAKYPFFHVQEYEDGRIVLEPRELTEPFRISPEDLQALDEAIEEINNGYEPQVFDLSAW